jgi:CheY-like chemotaxis protein
VKPLAILLIEDEPEDVVWTQRVFAKLSLSRELIHVSDGPTALRALYGPEKTSRVEPTLVLLDLGLPGMDGLSLLERIRSDEATQDVPVFVLTGSCEDNLLLESYRLGATAFITKPLTLEKFTIALNEAGYVWTLVRQKSRASGSAPEASGGAAASARRKQVRAQA